MKALFADLFDIGAKNLIILTSEQFACLCWEVWELRNDWLHGKAMCKLEEAVDRTLEMLGRYKECYAREKPSKEHRSIRWIKPHYPSLVLNVDGGGEEGGKSKRGGGCLRNYIGDFIFAFAGEGRPDWTC